MIMCLQVKLIDSSDERFLFTVLIFFFAPLTFCKVLKFQ